MIGVADINLFSSRRGICAVGLLHMLMRVASNAGANIFSGAIASAYLLVVTAIGSRTWHGAEFASWALALSIAAIAPVFAVNLSAVVTRRIVESRHSQFGIDNLAIVIAGRRIGHHLTYVALGILVCAGTLIQARFSSGVMTTSSFLTLLSLLLLTNCWLLLWQTRFGQYYADERNWLPALTLAAARIGGVLGMIMGLALFSKSLVSGGFGLCAGTWAGLACSQLLLPKPSPVGLAEIGTTRLDIRKQYLKNVQLLSGFAIGSVSMLVIQYSIPPLMALIAPKIFNAFYLASVLNMVAVGVLTAATSAMLAPLTRWHSTGESHSLRRFTLLSPLFCAISCLTVLSVCWYAGGSVLHAISVRTASLTEIRVFLALLGFQTIIRNAAAGYAMYIASAGTSRQMALPLLLEIALAFTVAVPLGWCYGERALIYGLIFSSLIGSLYSSQVVASLKGARHISLRAALPSLLGTQITISVIWWLIVRFSL